MGESGQHILIIAEAGVNHNGDVTLAKKLVDAAGESGADIVKFQTAALDSLVSRHAAMAEYQKRNMGESTGQREMLEKLLLKEEDFLELHAYCKKRGITFLSTPFDIGSIHFLNPLQKLWKIPSGEITDYPYLVEIAKTGKPVLLSTGMSTPEEIGEAYDVLRENGSGEITLLHCTTEYPAPLTDVNLKAMLTLRETFGCPAGYSDHTEGITVSVAAAALGATVIEKHFTLDRNMKGPDHKASLEPVELAELVRRVREVETALGNGTKRPSESELKNRAAARKSIIAKRDIKKGEPLTEENITTKRPGTGISPMRWRELTGRKAKRDFMEDDLIEL